MSPLVFKRRYRDIMFSQKMLIVNTTPSFVTIQLFALLSSYLCFIFFIYLDLYVLGDYVSVSEGS